MICTAYIYRSLKPIPAWSNGWVVPNYLALSAMTGALWLAALSTLFGYRLPGAGPLVFATIMAALLLKLAYWRFIDTHPGASTAETATGLGFLGKVRLLEAPHTSENYLLKEMGFRIARKHAQNLRVIALCLGFLLPFALAIVAVAASGVIVPICWLLAAAIGMIGVLVNAGCSLPKPSTRSRFITAVSCNRSLNFCRAPPRAVRHSMLSVDIIRVERRA